MAMDFNYFEEHRKNGSLNELIKQIKFYHEKGRFSGVHNDLMHYVDQYADDATKNFLYQHIENLNRVC
ncbi:hypothetical protein U0033_18635 [Chitinophaga sancti]|uniref:FCD domain-containing protein n=1 Tax=Chitinophaga sancti TaxID=1004 RepID=A0ABZ0XBI2_9BACT|nr:hypothetical protein [Chitinophaga sancti]WQD59909.1 hypothetical protein U0033_18635 [Chitinophaga sancti]WQG87961.1 hypothetical protein SR876_23830 [Chitinophaga sancti]